MIAWVSDVQEILDTIDDRLVEIQEQIASLQAVRFALTATPRPRGQRRAGPRRPAPTKPRTSAPRSRATSMQNSKAPAPSPDPPAAQPATTAQVAKPPQPARRRRPRQPAGGPAGSQAAQRATEKPPGNRSPKPSPRRRSKNLAPGELESVLRESEQGLSLVALARSAGVSEAKVRDRLRELERSGEARRSGSRRTSLWRLVSDEDRIAERAAELARA